jgi:hypothetical protein
VLHYGENRISKKKKMYKIEMTDPEVAKQQKNKANRMKAHRPTGKKKNTLVKETLITGKSVAPVLEVVRRPRLAVAHKLVGRPAGVHAAQDVACALRHASNLPEQDFPISEEEVLSGASIVLLQLGPEGLDEVVSLLAPGFANLYRRSDKERHIRRR